MTDEIDYKKKCAELQAENNALKARHRSDLAALSAKVSLAENACKAHKNDCDKAQTATKALAAKLEPQLANALDEAKACRQKAGMWQGKVVQLFNAFDPSSSFPKDYDFEANIDDLIIKALAISQPSKEIIEKREAEIQKCEALCKSADAKIAVGDFDGLTDEEKAALKASKQGV